MIPRIALLVVGCCSGLAAAAEPIANDSAWDTLHRAAVNRPRRIIFNNDGNEPVYYCKAATAAELLSVRTSPLVGSQVDSIFYCTWSSGFGLFTHNTRVGQVFDTREEMFKPNRTREFLDAGLDPLQVMVDFARSQRIELVWSMRMNDTHDGSGAAYGPVMFRANRLKQQHPEWLIGSKEKRPKYGSWSAVDYGKAEIRDLAFRYCQEVCEGYGVDGIELDFFRHAFFFKCSGAGQPCGEAELKAMTDLVRRIRAMTREMGRKRGRPILLAVRVPDSLEYCRFIGLDLEGWLADGQVDLLMVSGYTQLNPWDYSVQLGRRYGVKVYPSLDEPRVRDPEAQKLRAGLATYRGRALTAWSAGVDGIYMFNFFDPRSPLWRQLGDPAALRKLDRNYFASVRGVGHVPAPHQKFINVPTLNPGSPIAMTPEATARIEFQVGENLAEAGAGTSARLRLQFKQPPDPQQLRAVLNGQELAAGDLLAPWLEYVLPHTLLHQGANTLELSFRSPPNEAPALLDLYIAVTPG